MSVAPPKPTAGTAAPSSAPSRRRCGRPTEWRSRSPARPSTAPTPRRSKRASRVRLNPYRARVGADSRFQSLLSPVLLVLPAPTLAQVVDDEDDRRREYRQGDDRVVVGEGEGHPPPPPWKPSGRRRRII